MSTKSLILSSSGLKNVTFTKTKNLNDSEEFRFIFENAELKLNYLFAEFISPLVSKIHQTDPTVNYLHVINQIPNSAPINKSLLEKVDDLSRGNSVEVTKEMIKGIQQIAILLGNFELFSKINELFQEEEENENETIERSLLSLQFFENEMNLPNIQSNNQLGTIIDFLASHFYLIDEEKLLTIPKHFLYSILSNQNLKLKNEDSLLDFINKLFEQAAAEDESLKIEFYEIIEFTSLSENKMREFLSDFNSNEMTKSLWSKLVECFYLNEQIVSKINTVEERMSLYGKRYSTFDMKDNPKNKEKYKLIEYDNNENNRFKGIITELGRGDPLNVLTEKIIDVSCSSLFHVDYSNEQNIFNFNDDKKFFESENKPNSWFCYDFKERKVKLTHYSLRSHGYPGKTNCRVKTWVIEGSNNNEDFIEIDKRENEDSVVDVSASNTFKINQNSTNDFYRYIRIRQTNVNSCNNHHLDFSVIEFFGTILEP